MPNFGDPLWGEDDWNGAPAAPFTFPPADPDEERNRIDIDQIRASVKSGGKSQDDSKLVTTIGTQTPGNLGIWDPLGNLIDGGVQGSPSFVFPKYKTSWSSQTSVTVTHPLGTTAVIVQVFDASGVLVIPESVTVTSSSVVTLTFGAAFTGSVVVIG